MKKAPCKRLQFRCWSLSESKGWSGYWPHSSAKHPNPTGRSAWANLASPFDHNQARDSAYRWTRHRYSCGVAIVCDHWSIKQPDVQLLPVYCKPSRPLEAMRLDRLGEWQCGVNYFRSEKAEVLREELPAIRPCANYGQRHRQYDTFFPIHIGANSAHERPRRHYL